MKPEEVKQAIEQTIERARLRLQHDAERRLGPLLADVKLKAARDLKRELKELARILPPDVPPAIKTEIHVNVGAAVVAMEYGPELTQYLKGGHKPPIYKH